MTRRPREVPPAPVAGLIEALGEGVVLWRPEQMLVYECDGLTHFRERPLAVVLARSRADVVAAVRYCDLRNIPFAPRGAGTGLSGGAVPPPGGVIVETSRMRRILEIRERDHVAVVEPGVVNAELSRAAAPFGLCWAPDPSSGTVCTLGGNVAENAGGPHGLKYGSTTRHVLGLEMVLPDGGILRLGGAATDLAFPDLAGFVTGSEGTLGVVTEITCRLLPIPAAVETLLASFPTLDDACAAVSALIAGGMAPSALEALDRRAIEAVEQSVWAAGYPVGAGAVLLIELDGHPAAVAGDRERVVAACRNHGALATESARDPEHRARLWRGRKGAFGAMGRVAPDLHVQDAVVPRSKLPAVIAGVCEICDGLGLRLANVFHAGDGNLHPNISYDGRDPDEVRRVMEAGRRIALLCLEAGGALSGEHGIGLEKRDLMPFVFTADDLATFDAARRVFDPRGLCNPGKALPTPGACADRRPPPSPEAA